MAKSGEIGAGAPAELKDDGLQLDPAPETSEWWYFDGLFDDGSGACVVFNVPPWENVMITINRPDGVREKELLKYLPGQFSASKDQCDVRIGPHWAKGDLHTYQIHAEGNTIGADLTFTGIVPPWKMMPDHPEGSVIMGWIPAIPFGTAEGTITYGGQTHQVRGSGYHDHNWFNTPQGKAIDHWYWGRGNAGPYSYVFAVMYFKTIFGNVRGSLLMLAKDGEVVIGHSGTGMDVKTGRMLAGPGGRQYPQQVDFEYKVGGDRVHLAYRNQKWIEWISHSDAASEPLPGNPWYYRWRADVELQVTTDGSTETVKGEGTYELQMY
jgi:hypothetical protein